MTLCLLILKWSMSTAAWTNKAPRPPGHQTKATAREQQEILGSGARSMYWWPTVGRRPPSRRPSASNGDPCALVKVRKHLLGSLLLLPGNLVFLTRYLPLLSWSVLPIRTFLLDPEFHHRIWIWISNFRQQIRIRIPALIIGSNRTQCLLTKIGFNNFGEKSFNFRIKLNHYRYVKVFEWFYIWIRIRFWSGSGFGSKPTESTTLLMTWLVLFPEDFVCLRFYSCFSGGDWAVLCHLPQI